MAVGSGQDEGAARGVLEQSHAEFLGVPVGHGVRDLCAPVDGGVDREVEAAPALALARAERGDLVVAPAGRGVRQPGHGETDPGEQPFGLPRVTLQQVPDTGGEPFALLLAGRRVGAVGADARRVLEDAAAQIHQLPGGGGLATAALRRCRLTPHQGQDQSHENKNVHQ
ncbi:hypothetical protein [Streptomyces sp. I6]|uniref:hypothetical protein n=1 Tax=Streptomyces sp. I6 TaxID=2483113 RepID=UPI0028804852|nr:hypothetical protein [Streptomyces sp. I6]